MYLAGVLIMVVGLLFNVLILNWDISDVFWLISAPTLVFFMFVMAAAIVYKQGFKTFIAAMNALLSKKYHISAVDKEKAINLLKFMSKSVTVAMFLHMTTIILLTLVRSDDLMWFEFGQNLSMNLLSVIYGLTINLVGIYPAINILETRYNLEEKRVISEKQVIDKLLELCYKQGISPDEIIDADEISFKRMGQ
jgi:hypothetical protein